MLNNNYSKWESFLLAGRKFLALYSSDGCCIWGENMENYGSYRDADNFRTMYKKEGEALKL
jgi:hypothetical protein